MCEDILENATQFWKCGFALKSTLFEGAQIKLAPHFFLPFSNVCGMRFLQRNWPKWAKYVRGSCSKKTLPTFTQSQHHSNRETGTALHYHVYPLHWVATRIVKPVCTCVVSHHIKHKTVGIARSNIKLQTLTILVRFSQPRNQMIANKSRMWCTNYGLGIVPSWQDWDGWDTAGIVRC